MGERKDRIGLDATIGAVINHATFRAILANGHELVAYTRAPDQARAEALCVGDTVRVEMSPCDMSSGRIVWLETEVER